MSLLTHVGYGPWASRRLWSAGGSSVVGYLRNWQALRHLARPVAGRSARELVRQLFQQLRISLEFNSAETAQLLPAGNSFVALAPVGATLPEVLALYYALSETHPTLCLADEGQLADAALLLGSRRQVLATTGASPSSRISLLLPLLQNQVPVLWWPSSAATGSEMIADCQQRSIAVVWATVEPLPSRQSVSALPVVRELVGWPAELISWQGQHLRVRMAPSAPITAPAPVPTISRELLEADLAALDTESLLMHTGVYEVYHARHHQLPHVLPALRQLRARGLVANPRHDASTLQVFIYDREAGRLVAGCRLGAGRKVMREQGKAGFAAHQHLRLPKALRPLLRQSVELSATFVAPGYQSQRLPPMLLWQAVTIFLARHPRYRYLLGEVQWPVPVEPGSNEELAAFLHQHYMAVGTGLAQPRKRFRYHTLPAIVRAWVGNPDPKPERILHRLASQMAPAHLPVPGPGQQWLRRQARLLALYSSPTDARRLAGLVLLDAAGLANFAHRRQVGC